MYNVWIQSGGRGYITLFEKSNEIIRANPSGRGSFEWTSNVIYYLLLFAGNGGRFRSADGET